MRRRMPKPPQPCRRDDEQLTALQVELHSLNFRESQLASCSGM